MRARLLLSAIVLSAAVPALSPAPARADDTVVIYRCTGADGRLTLRDSPCEKGQRQETRSMVRPKDAPPRPQRPSPAVAAAPSPLPPQVIVINTPRPLYECVTPDGERYVSETPEGRPRQVPAWTMGAPVLARVPVYQPGQLEVGVDDGHVSGHYSSGSYGSVVVPTAAGYGATMWVRDACAALPQVEVCDRLRDRRGQIGRRFTIAQPSERAELSREQRGIDARLAQDCR